MAKKFDRTVMEHAHGDEYTSVTHAAHATGHHFMWITFGRGCVASVTTAICDPQDYAAAMMKNAARVQPEVE